MDKFAKVKFIKHFVKNNTKELLQGTIQGSFETARNDAGSQKWVV